MEFPGIGRLSDKAIIQAARTINRGKASAWDCVGDEIFQIGGRCCQTGRCSSCSNKLNAIRKMLTP
jgi:hypothetical protein